MLPLYISREESNISGRIHTIISKKIPRAGYSTRLKNVTRPQE